MILGIGIDIVEISRMDRPTQNGRFYTDFFSEEEQQVFKACSYAAQTVAGRFAAKEAVLKALGLGLGDMPLREISIVRLPSGRPEARLAGAAKRKAEELGVKRIHISISHDGAYAIAQAVAEGD
jgi:phosphopantethiene--protein transferase domain